MEMSPRLKALLESRPEILHEDTGGGCEQLHINAKTGYYAITIPEGYDIPMTIDEPVIAGFYDVDGEWDYNEETFDNIEEFLKAFDADNDPKTLRQEEVELYTKEEKLNKEGRNESTKNHKRKVQ